MEAGRRWKGSRERRRDSIHLQQLLHREDQKAENNIDKNYVKHPLEKLKKKMELKNLKFTLKTVSEKKMRKAMTILKKKKIEGKDGISQGRNCIRHRNIGNPTNKDNKQLDNKKGGA